MSVIQDILAAPNNGHFGGEIKRLINNVCFNFCCYFQQNQYNDYLTDILHFKYKPFFGDSQNPCNNLANFPPEQKDDISQKDVNQYCLLFKTNITNKTTF